MERNARWSPARFAKALEDQGYSLRGFLPAYNAFAAQYAESRRPKLDLTCLTVSDKTLRRWIKGEELREPNATPAAPSVWQLEAIANFLNRNQEYFFEAPEEPRKPRAVRSVR